MGDRPRDSLANYRLRPHPPPKVRFGEVFHGSGPHNTGRGYTRRVKSSNPSSDVYDAYLESLDNQQDQISAFMSLSGAQQGIVFNDFIAANKNNDAATLAAADVAYYSSQGDESLPGASATIVAGFPQLGMILWGSSEYQKKWAPLWKKMSTSDQLAFMDSYLKAEAAGTPLSKTEVENYLTDHGTGGGTEEIVEAAVAIAAAGLVALAGYRYFSA